jgi:hypothetical protein
MGTSAQDKSTQKVASSGAESAAATQAANAGTAQTSSTNQQNSLFGAYDPSSNTYSGGSESPFLSPTSLDTTGLTGSYQNLYTNQANQQAQAVQQAVATSQQNAANHGMGQTPAGYGADQERQAYQTQATNNGTNYANAFTGQHNEAVDQYQKANAMLGQTQAQNQGSATANNSGAAGTNSSLYGTASQQKQNALGYFQTNLANAAKLATGV